MTIEPGRQDLVIYQGATFSVPLTWSAGGTPVDLTGWTAAMHCRRAVDDASPFLTLNTDNGRITLGGALGTIALLVDAASTAALTAGSGVYDLKLSAPGDSEKDFLINGTITVKPMSTR